MQDQDNQNQNNQTETFDIGGLKVEVPKYNNLSEFATKKNNNPNAVDLFELQRNQDYRSIPSQEIKNQSLYEKRDPKGSGLFQMALRAERESLKQGLQKFRDDINSKAKLSLSESDINDLIDYLPNARFSYFNNIIKMALNGISIGTEDAKFITEADLAFVDTVWLNPRTRSLLKSLLRANLGKRDGFSVPPIQSRSNIRFSDNPGLKTGQYIALKNPGNVYLPMSNREQIREDISDKLTAWILHIDDKIKKAMSDIELMTSVSDLMGALPDNQVQKTLMWLMDKINDRHITFKDLKNISDQLNRLMSFKQSKYLLSLADPWKHRSARIPSLISLPSATFTVRSVVTLTTNALGNVSFVFMPYWLTNSTNLGSAFGLNNNVGLTGTAASNFYLAVDVGQTLPAPFYPRYRLVSSGLRLYCYPSSNNDNGIAVISVTLEEITAQLFGVPLTQAAQFGDFNQIENGYYKKTTTLASREVQEHVYIPLDEACNDYFPTAITGRTGFSWAGYISGAAPSTSIARVEFICNYEGVLDNQYTDYLPSDNATPDLDPKQVFPLVSKMKDQEVLTPQTIGDLLKQENQLYGKEDIIDLPATPRERKKAEQELKGLQGELGDLVKDFFPAVPKDKQSSWLSDVMDVVSPVASSIIQNVAGRYVPFINPFFK